MVRLFLLYVKIILSQLIQVLCTWKQTWCTTYS